MITIKEIAAAAGVSVGTVDRALHNRGRVNPETSEKIRRIAGELGYVPNELGKALAIKKKKLKIGFMIPDSKQAPSEFYEEIRKGAERETLALKKYDITVAFYPIQFDFEGGEDIYPCLEAEEWDSLDGLVTLGGNSDQLHDILAEAEKRKIPVTLYNMDTKRGKHLAVVQCDYGKAGRMAAGLAALLTAEQGEVYILSMDSDAVPSYTERLAGFEEEISRQYPGLHICGRKVIKTDSYNPVRLKEVVDALKLGEKADVIYVINPGNDEIFDAIGSICDTKKIQVITNDLTQQQRRLVMEGKISMTISQDPENQGKQALRTLANYLIFEQKPPKRVLYTDLTVHFRQNI